MKKLDNYSKVFRKQSGLTQKETGFLVNKSEVQMSRWEGRKNFSHFKILMQLSIIYGKEIKDLLPVFWSDCEKEIMNNIDGLKTAIEQQKKPSSMPHKLPAKIKFLEKVKARNN